eukprot:Rmarinus@m.13884
MALETPSLPPINLLDIPDNAIELILSFVCPVDHLVIWSLNRFFRTLYDNKWKSLVLDTFGETHLLCGCAHTACVAPCEEAKENWIWHREFVVCLRRVWALEKGAFVRVNRYSYSFSDTMAQPSLVTRQIRKTNYLVCRQLWYDGSGVDFSLRELQSGRLTLQWTAPVATLFDSFHPTRNRIFMDLELYGDTAMAVYFSTSREVLRVYLWSVPENVSDLGKAFETAMRWDPPLLQPSEQASDPLTSHARKPRQPRPVWVRFRPPHIAIDSVDEFALWDVETNRRIYTVPHSNRSVVSAAWDNRLIVTAHSSGLLRIGRPMFGKKARGHHRPSVFEGECCTAGMCGIPLLDITVGTNFYGRYLGFFRTGCTERDFAVIYASDPHTCHVVWGNPQDRHITHSHSGVLSPSVSEHRGSQCLVFGADENDVPGVDYTTGSTMVSLPHVPTSGEDDEFAVFLPPQGLTTGKKGPFLAWSDGCDVYWFRVHDAEGLGSPLRISLQCTEMEYFQAEDSKGWPARGQDRPCPTQGLARALFAGNDLVQVWTDFREKTSTVTVLCPCSTAVQGPASLPCLLCATHAIEETKSDMIRGASSPQPPPLTLRSNPNHSRPNHCLPPANKGDPVDEDASTIGQQ